MADLVLLARNPSLPGRTVSVSGSDTVGDVHSRGQLYADTVDGLKMYVKATANDESGGDVSLFEVQNSLGVAQFKVDEDGDITTLGDISCVDLTASGVVTFTSTSSNPDLNVSGDVSIGETLTVTGQTTLNGGVDLGSDSSDDVSFLGLLDTDITVGNTIAGGAFDFTMEAEAVDTAGNAFNIAAGTGGAASGVVGGAGGAATFSGGDGGAGDVTYLAGAGGSVTIAAGDAGADGGAGGANGGALALNAGNATGAGTDGAINIGASNTSAVNVTPVSTFTGKITANGGMDIDTANLAFTGGAGSYFFPPDEVQSPLDTAAQEGAIRYNDAANTLQYRDDAGWVTLASSAGVNLQTAYDNFGAGPATVTLDATGDLTWTVVEASGYDVIWTGTNGNYASTDSSNSRLKLGNGAATAVHVLLDDSTQMIFGTGEDVTMAWDGTDFDILAAADDSVFNIGNGTNSFDVNIYGSTASYGVLWDASANTLSVASVRTTADSASLSVISDGPVLGAAESSIGIFAEINNDVTDDATSYAAAYAAAPASGASGTPGNLVGLLLINGFDKDIVFLDNAADVIADGSLTIDAQGGGGLTLKTTNTGDTVTISSGAGAVDIDAATSMTLDTASGSISINATGGPINIGNDADAQQINIGTGAAARSITMGNATGATSFTLNAGTGAVQIGANATDHNTTLGSTSGGSFLTLQSGTEPMTLDAQGNFVIDAEGTIVATGVGASSVTIDSGDLTLATTTSGDINLTSKTNIVNSTVAGADNGNITFACHGTGTVQVLTGTNLVVADGAIGGADAGISLNGVYLNSNTSSADCGAAKIGTANGVWTNITPDADNVQEVLEALDAAIGAADFEQTFTSGSAFDKFDIVAIASDGFVDAATVAVTAHGTTGCALSVVGIAMVAATGAAEPIAVTTVPGAVITDDNTQGWAFDEGDEVFLSTGGQLVDQDNVTVTAGQAVVKIGVCIDATATANKILFQPEFRFIN